MQSAQESAAATEQSASRPALTTAAPPRNPAAPGSAKDDLPSWDTVRAAEQAAIDASREEPLEGYVGLAFSGGGIRSATFNLGVIQALAAHRLLHKFDYLSTVSGGGYIGAWLTGLVHRARSCSLSQKPHVGEELEEAIALTADGAAVGHARPGAKCPMYVREAVEHLRTFSNYLTPRPGFFGLDTLTGIAIYCRNLTLNFALILLPAVTFFLLVQWLAHEAITMSGSAMPYTVTLVMLAITSLLIGAVFAPMPASDTRNATATSDWLTMTTAAFALLFCVSTALWFWKGAPAVRPALWHCMLYGAIASIVLWALTLLARWVTGLVVTAYAQRDAGPSAADTGSWIKDDRLITPRVIFGLLSGAVLSGAAGGALLAWVFDVVQIMAGHFGPIDPQWGMLAHLQDFANDARNGPVEWLILSVTPVLIMAVLALVFALQVAVARRSMSVHDTEIVGRFGAAVFLLSMIWLASFAIAGFTAATLVNIQWASVWAGVTWVVSTLTGVLLGKSAAVDGKRKRSATERVAVVFPYLFIGGFVLFSALLASSIAESLWFKVAAPPEARPDTWIGWVQHYTNAVTVAETSVLWATLGFLSASVVLAFTVDINFFSYHLFYRNRLARCYLGASRWATGDWRPSRITNLDPDDDVRMKDLAPEGRPAQRPYHIVNTALNLTRPADTAWLQRKAAPFVFTPKYCGYSMPGTGGLGERLYYRPTADYLGEQGPELAYAMTISGAAASPNMGYHSSHAMAFLLTVFNVRLGSWCGNPNRAPSWKQRSPRFAYRYLLSELFGSTDEKKHFLYLSDGGHFDNLGVYELVRRRCKLIVASDAGADPGYQLEDLANTIEKCELDFGVRFGEMKLKKFAPRSVPVAGPIDAKRQCTSQFLVSSIHYSERPEDVGTFIYIKSAICGDEPADILHYAASHALFPHESTSDQWFDEQQFESYRKLGYRAASAARAEMQKALDEMVPTPKDTKQAA